MKKKNVNLPANHFSNLPDDCLLSIFKFFDPEIISTVYLLNKDTSKILINFMKEKNLNLHQILRIGWAQDVKEKISSEIFMKSLERHIVTKVVRKYKYNKLGCWSFIFLLLLVSIGALSFGAITKRQQLALDNQINDLNDENSNFFSGLENHCGNIYTSAPATYYIQNKGPGAIKQTTNAVRLQVLCNPIPAEYIYTWEDTYDTRIYLGNRVETAFTSCDYQNPLLQQAIYGKYLFVRSDVTQNKLGYIIQPLLGIDCNAAAILPRFNSCFPDNYQTYIQNCNSISLIQNENTKYNYSSPALFVGIIFTAILSLSSLIAYMSIGCNCYDTEKKDSYNMIDPKLLPLKEFKKNILTNQEIKNKFLFFTRTIDIKKKSANDFRSELLDLQNLKHKKLELFQNPKKSKSIASRFWMIMMIRMN